MGNPPAAFDVAGAGNVTKPDGEPWRKPCRTAGAKVRAPVLDPTDEDVVARPLSTLPRGYYRYTLILGERRRR